MGRGCPKGLDSGLKPIVHLKSLTHPLVTVGPASFFPFPPTVCISPISTQIRAPPPRPTSAPHATNTSQTRARSRFPTAPVSTSSQLYRTRTSGDTRHVLYSEPLFMLSKPKQPAHHLHHTHRCSVPLACRRISLILSSELLPLLSRKTRSGWMCRITPLSVTLTLHVLGTDH